VVELLDDLFARAAAADERDEMNFIRKHARALEQKGVTAGATARLFSNPAGKSLCCTLCIEVFALAATFGGVGPIVDFGGLG
jgi:hypothetical protein